VEGLIQDLCFGARLLWKNSGFTLVAMMTIALGVGANTSIFSVVDAMLFRPLPYVEPDRLFMVVEFDTRTSQTFGTTLLLDFLETRNHHRGIEGPIVSEPASFGSLLAGERPETSGSKQSLPTSFNCWESNRRWGEHFCPQSTNRDMSMSQS